MPGQCRQLIAYVCRWARPQETEPFCGLIKSLVRWKDNLIHHLRAERFYTPQMINGRMAAADGPIKTLPLRRIKDSPTYLYDGRLLMLADTIKFFNLTLGVKLTEQEKRDLVAFMRRF